MLRDIERAREENLILKDILRNQPHSLSSSTSPESATSSRTTSFSESVKETQSVEATAFAPGEHSRHMANNSQLSPLSRTTTTSRNSDLTGRGDMNPSSFEDSEAFGFFLTPSITHQNIPSSEDSDTFDFFMTPSRSHQGQGEYFQLQHGPGKEMDGRAFSVSSTISYSNPKLPKYTEQYSNLDKRRSADLEPYSLTPTNDSNTAFESPYENPSQDDDDQCRRDPPEYYGHIPQHAPLREAPNKALPSTLSYNLDACIDHQSFLREADPTSARRGYATTSLLNHEGQLGATDWWQEIL